MKYLDSAPFSSGENSQKYRDNWEKTFKKKKKKDLDKKVCKQTKKK